MNYKQIKGTRFFKFFFIKYVEFNQNKTIIKTVIYLVLFADITQFLIYLHQERCDRYRSVVCLASNYCFILTVVFNRYK